MQRFLCALLAVLSASSALAVSYTTDPPAVVPGPPVTIADMVASRSVSQAKPLGAVTPGGYGFFSQRLVPVAINAAGNNNDFFHFYYFLVHAVTVAQGIIVALLPPSGTNVGTSTPRFA